jgi:hypothetical protein
VLLLTVNLDEGDLPLRTAFPILMMNALNWFTENRGDLRESLPTGTITEIVGQAFQPDRDVSQDLESNRATGQPGKADLHLIAPDGRRSPLPANSERLSLGPLDQCGVWRVIASEGGEDSTLLELACNLADRNESDVRVSKSDEAKSTPVVSVSLFGNRPVSVWLIASAWLLMAIEWWAYQRRVIE